METLQILGWIYLGVALGSISTIIVLSMLQAGKLGKVEDENISLRLQRTMLKDEILKLSKRGKPAPRKRKYWKKKPVK
jgi:hypothetical protein|tara:strand:+ start:1293 stop:1526 length:234 start_codon:yes stop_codon:yes gene_type:complete